MFPFTTCNWVLVLMLLDVTVAERVPNRGRGILICRNKSWCELTSGLCCHC